MSFLPQLTLEISRSPEMDPPAKDGTSGLPREPRPGPRGTASYQRRRAVKACQVCRARRTKCDNLKPSCSFCLKVGATCIQSPVDLSSFDPASLKILERLDDLEEMLKSASLGSSDEPYHKTRVVDGGETRLPSEVAPPAVDLGTVTPRKLDDLLSLPCFRDFFVQEQHLLGMSPGRPTQLSELPMQSPASVLSGLDLEPVRVKELLDNFFSYVHVKNPIFDERVTRRVIQSTLLDGIDWSPESCLSLLICALGSIATPFGPSHGTMPGTSAYTNAMSFFRAAQKRIGALMCVDDIIAPQCLFLSGVFLMCVLQPVKAWRYFVQALAHCQQLGFLSQTSQEQYLTDHQGAAQSHDIDSLHQAAYWSAWKSERELRNAFSLPDFSPNDHGVNLYPAFFPTPPMPRPGETTSADADQQREQTSWYFYLAEISLRRLGARICDEMESMIRTHPTRPAFLHAAAAAVPAYEAQIQQWIDSLPPCLSFDAPAEDDDVCRFVLRGHAGNLFEMIYWPFLWAHLDNSALDASMLTPFTGLAEKAVDHHARRLTINEPGYRHRHHGTFPMMQSCSRSALILLATWFHNQPAQPAGGHGSGCSLHMPPDWAISVTAVLRLLEFWSSETPNFDSARGVLEQALFRVGG